MYKKCKEILNKLQSEGKIKISNFEFPPKQPLKLKLKDILEDEVDEKYYLSDEWLKKIKYEYENNTICETRYDEGIRTFKDNICGSLRTIDAGGNKCVIQVKEATKQGYKEPQKGYGYCNKHYIRFKKYGNPLHTENKTKEKEVVSQ